MTKVIRLPQIQKPCPPQKRQEQAGGRNFCRSKSFNQRRGGCWGPCKIGDFVGKRSGSPSSAAVTFWRKHKSRGKPQGLAATWWRWWESTVCCGFALHTDRSATKRCAFGDRLALPAKNVPQAHFLNAETLTGSTPTNIKNVPAPKRAGTFWWRWWESNPRPKIHSRNFLRA